MGKNSRMKAERRLTRENNTSDTTQVSSRLPPRKEGPYVSSGPNDLFDNPMIKAAQAALSDEDREKFRILGESMFGGVNFENNQTINNMPPPMSEAVAYLETHIRSGMHPSLLDDNEKAILSDAFGNEWYKEYGYVKEDLDDIVTLTPTFKVVEK
jgi:hypothetical protein